MIVESGRAAEVVRRLRDFFRTGAMQLEAVEASALSMAWRASLRRCSMSMASNWCWRRHRRWP
jgi:hypothetical protein